MAARMLVTVGFKDIKCFAAPHLAGREFTAPRSDDSALVVGICGTMLVALCFADI